jgi:hypothetical protein
MPQAVAVLAPFWTSRDLGKHSSAGKVGMRITVFGMSCGVDNVL